MKVIRIKTNTIHRVIEHTKDGFFIIDASPAEHRIKIKEGDAIIVDETCYYLLAMSGRIVKADSYSGGIYYHRATSKPKISKHKVIRVIKNPSLPNL